MKNIIPLVAAAVLAVSGCASVDISREGGHTVAVVENSGWYLFNAIPIASGDPGNPNGRTCRLFSSTVNLESNIAMLDRAICETGAVSCIDTVSYTTDEKVFAILLRRLSYHTTAELVMEQETAEQKEEETQPCSSPRM